MSNDVKKIIRELVEEVIEEMTGTSAVAGVNTPNWGRKKTKGSEATVGLDGYTLVGKEEKSTVEEKESGDSLPMLRRELTIVEEGKSKYKNFKDSDLMKNHRKVSLGIKEAKKMLGEVEYLLGICERLKNECDIPMENLWKSTAPDMKEMHARMKNIAKRIHKIGK